MTILDGLISDDVLEAVRKLKGRDWKTTYKAVKNYREKLLEVQGRRCAYCQRPIYRDEVGFRELDHVLPKAQSPADVKEFAAAPFLSNALEDRRYTAGYAEFRYEPLNLVISCSLCNSHKGTFDGRANRANAFTTYSKNSRDYEWVHPYFDVWSHYISVAEGMLYTAIKGDPKGLAVIEACGLKKSEQLIARIIDSYIYPYDELRVAMNAIVVGRDCDGLDFEAMASRLHKHYQVGSALEIEKLLREMREEVVKNSAIKLGSILDTIGPRLGETGKIPPAPQVKTSVRRTRRISSKSTTKN